MQSIANDTNKIIGVTAGKFYPFHKGHLYLIETALDETDFLYIFLVTDPRETIDSNLRSNWIRKTLINLGYNNFIDFLIIQCPNIPGHENNSKTWANYVNFLKPKDYPEINRVYTSENYGQTWAKELGAQHRLVDFKRTAVPISGREIRRDPIKSWSYLPGKVREHFVQNIVLAGGESVGKTTIAKSLAQEIGCPYVPEAGREYTETYGVDKEDQNIWAYIYNQEIINTQHAAWTSPNGYIVNDTDLLCTAVWYEHWTKARFDSFYIDLLDYIEKSTPAYYFILSPEVPWIQDELGTRGEKEYRYFFHQRTIDLLEYFNREYFVVEGNDYENRYKQVLTNIPY